MQYALMIYVDPDAQEGFTDEENAAVTAEYMAIRSDSRVKDGAELASPGTVSTVRSKEGESFITDGPFADTKEVLGGYFIVDAEDLDAAIEIAGRIPAARLGGAVEVWPLVVRGE
jgi:hypothetical protein